jgi:hypothetical protein
MYAVVMSVGISGVASSKSVNIYLPPLLLFVFNIIKPFINCAFADI